MRDMTKGNLYKHILTYAIPLILGNILQLTYSAVDSILVSKGVGVAALSAVSVSTPVSVLIVNAMSGIGIGASVLMSKFFGAGEREKLKSALASTLAFGLMASAVILFLGYLFSPGMLSSMNVPSEIFAESLMYLRIIFIGNLFTFQYNIMANALRAVGDSKTPVYFVAVSSVMNIALDVVFIFGLHMGVMGAAIATVISQAVSAALCFVYVYRKIPLLQLHIRELRIHWKILREILENGLITALQQSCQPIGKLLIQRVVNVNGIDVIAAFNAGNKIEDYGRIPAQSFGNGIMTCAAQNNGAKQEKRAREALKKGVQISLVYYAIICPVILLFRGPLIKLFAPGTGAEEMITIGVSYLTIKAFTIVFPCITNAMQGYFRGMSMMRVTLFFTVLQITIRTIFVYILVPAIGINGEAYACAIGWTVMAIGEYAYFYYITHKGKSCFQRDSETN